MNVACVRILSVSVKARISLRISPCDHEWTVYMCVVCVDVCMRKDMT